MKKLKIACDLDNVLNNLTETLLELYNNDFNDSLKLEDITQYKIDSFVKPEAKITNYFQLDKLWMRVLPTYQSQEYLKILNQDHDVRIVTASHIGDMPTKYRWIKVFFPFIKREQIWTVFDKQWIDCDVLIDDFQDNLVGGSYHKILLDYPWNRNIKDQENNIDRAYNWKDVYEKIRLLETTKEFKGV